MNDDASQSTAGKAEPYQPCRFYLKGDCNQGRFCRWSHAFPRDATSLANHSYPGVLGRELPSRAVDDAAATGQYYGIGSPMMPGLSYDSAGAGILFGQGNYGMSGMGDGAGVYPVFGAQLGVPPPPPSVISTEGLERTRELLSAPIGPKGADGQVVRGNEDLLELVRQEAEYDARRNLASIARRAGVSEHDVRQLMLLRSAEQARIMSGGEGASLLPAPLPTRAQQVEVKRLGYNSSPDHEATVFGGSDSHSQSSFTPTAKPFEPRNPVNSAGCTFKPAQTQSQRPASSNASKYQGYARPAIAATAARSGSPMLAQTPLYHSPENAAFNRLPQIQIQNPSPLNYARLPYPQQQDLSLLPQTLSGYYGPVLNNMIAPPAYHPMLYAHNNPYASDLTLPLTLPLPAGDSRPQLLDRLRQEQAAVEASIYWDHGIDPRLASMMRPPHPPTASALSNSPVLSRREQKKPATQYFGDDLTPVTGRTAASQQSPTPCSGTTAYSPGLQANPRLDIRKSREKDGRPQRPIADAPRYLPPQIASLTDFPALRTMNFGPAQMNDEGPSLLPRHLQKAPASAIQSRATARSSPERPGTAHSCRTEVSGLGPLPQYGLEPFPTLKQFPTLGSNTSHSAVATGKSGLPPAQYQHTGPAPSRFHVRDNSSDAKLLSGLRKAVENVEVGDHSKAHVQNRHCILGNVERDQADNAHVEIRDRANDFVRRESRFFPKSAVAAPTSVLSSSPCKTRTSPESSTLDPGTKREVHSYLQRVVSEHDKEERPRSPVDKPWLTDPKKNEYFEKMMAQMKELEEKPDTPPIVHFDIVHNDGYGICYSTLSPWRHLQPGPARLPTGTIDLSDWPADLPPPFQYDLEAAMTPPAVDNPTPSPNDQLLERQAITITCAAAALTEYADNGCNYVRKDPPAGYEDQSSCEAASASPHSLGSTVVAEYAADLPSGNADGDGPADKPSLGPTIPDGCDFNDKYNQQCWCGMYPDSKPKQHE